MPRWAMVVDLDRCTACQACVVACQVENNVPPMGVEESDKGRAISWLGLVAPVSPRCIGCRYCPTACPYTVRQFNWKPPEGPEPRQTGLSPDVSIRPKGVVEKCTFCHHRLQRARDEARAERRELQEGDYLPACVETCPSRALVFGDLDDPRSEVSRLAESPRAFRLMEELGTEPKVIYLSKGEWGGEV